MPGALAMHLSATRFSQEHDQEHLPSLEYAAHLFTWLGGKHGLSETVCGPALAAHLCLAAWMAWWRMVWGVDI